jgi:hypothetical protein
VSDPADKAQQPPEMQFSQGTFNDAQRLHLRVSCEYMDKMLQRIEGVLHTEESASPFSHYQMDLSPAQGRVLEDYIRRLRSQLLRTLAWQGIQPPPPEIPATRSIATDLHFIAIAVSELRPNAMRGCGAMSEATAAELTGVLSELSSIVGQMMNYVKNELGDSLQQRIQKIATGDNASLLLQRIEHVVTAQPVIESVSCLATERRDGRVAEGARLESVYTARYPGFESLSLRHNFCILLIIKVI